MIGPVVVPVTIFCSVYLQILKRMLRWKAGGCPWRNTDDGDGDNDGGDRPEG